ncbi:MAG: CpaD family pilus assembly lipoprotein [Alphaproteobacteria bacterium]
MKKTLALLSTTLLLVGCAVYEPTVKPDYSIRVMPKPNGGMTAIAPTCASWSLANKNPYDNQPDPNFGCASARNLAMIVERPEDLIKGRDSGNSHGVMAVGAMRRYYNNQTRGLLDTDTAPDMSVAATTAPSAASSLTGDVTGGGAPAAAAPPAP